MSLAHTLIDAALAAQLTQNELKIFLVLLRQTLCFGKSADPLTTQRIAQLSHIRKDRVPAALQGFLKIGLFHTRPHARYQTEYFIAPELLAHPQHKIIAPALPKNRNLPQPSDTPPEKRVHTTKTITIKTHTTTSSGSTDELVANTSLPYPHQFSATEKQKAAHLLDGLSPDLAHHCLQIFSQALPSGKIQKPLAYLHQLVKAARNGTLDTSTLKQDEHSTKNHVDHSNQIKTLLAEIHSIDQLFQRSRLPMDTQTAAHRARLLEQLHYYQQHRH